MRNGTIIEMSFSRFESTLLNQISHAHCLLYHPQVFGESVLAFFCALFVSLRIQV